TTAASPRSTRPAKPRRTRSCPAAISPSRSCHRASTASRSNTISDRGAHGGYRAARGETLRAARIASRDPREIAAVASCLAAFCLGGELGRYVDGLGPLERIPIPLLMALARQCSLAGDQGRALRLLDEVHRADPEFPPGLLARAQVLMYTGRLEDAIRDVDRCLQRAPEIAQAHWLRSRLGTAGLGPDYP